jgi:hypothetical protein
LGSSGTEKGAVMDGRENADSIENPAGLFDDVMSKKEMNNVVSYSQFTSAAASREWFGT